MSTILHHLLTTSTSGAYIVSAQPVAKTCGHRWDSNPRRSACHADILPLNYWPKSRDFSICRPCKLVNARCSRLVDDLGWKYPQKSFQTSFHVFTTGIEPASRWIFIQLPPYEVYNVSFSLTSLTIVIRKHIKKQATNVPSQPRLHPLQFGYGFGRRTADDCALIYLVNSG